MQRFAIGVLAVALAGAGATVVLIDRYIDKRMEKTAAQAVDRDAPVMVLVAKDNIPIGKKLTGSDVTWQKWPKSGVQSEFLSAPTENGRKLKEVIGTVARRSILKGTPITRQAVFKSTNPGFLAGALDPNMRAMAIAITAQSGAAGFILPGDRVDVILIQDVGKKTRRNNADDGEPPKEFLSHVAETILQNVRVLASDQQVSDFEKKAKVAKTVTLEVTHKQAEKLAVATSMGKLSLALRSLSDVTDNEAAELARKKAIAEAISAEKGPTTTTDLEVSPLLAGTKKVPAASGTKIRIHRGDKSTTVEIK